MNADQVYETSVSGELKANLGLLDKVSIALRMLGRPSLLPKLATVATYMKRVQQLYDAYPRSYILFLRSCDLTSTKRSISWSSREATGAIGALSKISSKTA